MYAVSFSNGYTGLFENGDEAEAFADKNNVSIIEANFDEVDSYLEDIEEVCPGNPII